MSAPTICARCGECIDKGAERTTLFPQFMVHEMPCHPPADNSKRLIKAAAKLTEDYWEGRYYDDAPDREKLMAKDLAEMLDRVLEVVDG